jgi:FkbM family methyltransferase
MAMDRFEDDCRLFRELKAAGFVPRVIYDLGASTGIWSEAVAGVFPQARVHLFEPLAYALDLYTAELRSRLDRLPRLTLHPIALGDANGAAEMHVARDGYGSSLNDRGDIPEVEKRITVPVYRLDDYVAGNGLPGPDLIKIDCQGAERVILEGAPRALEGAQVLALETWFKRGYGPPTPLIGELVEFLGARSFSLVDLGERCYDDQHRLYSVDAFFLSESLIGKLRFPAAAPLALPARSGSPRAQGLLRRLGALTASRQRDTRLPGPRAAARSGPVVLRDADAVITHNEVNEKHGVGVLVRRLFLGQPNILSIRSRDMYGGQHELGDLALRISHPVKARDAVFARVLDAVGPSAVKRILCVPYFADDVRTALAVKEIFGVPLCTYLMDDQNVCADEIPDDLMRELLAKSSLRLGISAELCTVYGLKYGHRMWHLPPVVPSRLIPSQLNVPPAPPRKQGLVIGNIWGRHWVDLLRQTVRNSGVSLTWYCSGEFRWLPCGQDSLIADSIIPRGPLPETDLVRTLREAWFAVVPSGTLDPADDRRFIAQLSLPSRIPYLLATAHLPVLVLGSRTTGAARFVEQFGIGITADYERRSFVAAVDRLTQTEVNLAMRRRALAVAGRFSDAGAREWIWESLARGEAADRRYEDLLPAEPPELSHLLAARSR